LSSDPSQSAKFSSSTRLLADRDTPSHGKRILNGDRSTVLVVA
jgi:hypothetical protein